MHLAATLRNMGAQSTPETLRRCAAAAEEAGLESIWVVDHIAIPPEDSAGSGGRYVDPLTTLAWLAGCTRRIRLGVGVLVLPYRSPLPTVKQIASLQELSGERVILGAGVGWMAAEFRALAVPRSRRGRIADDVLECLNRCFAADEVSLNGQRLLFKPRPRKPPVLIGGGAPHALRRAARHGDGWLPMALPPRKLAKHMATYRAFCAEEGRAPGPATVMGALPLDDPQAAAETLAAYAEAGAERFVHGGRYADAGEFESRVERLAALHETAKALRPGA